MVRLLNDISAEEALEMDCIANVGSIAIMFGQFLEGFGPEIIGVDLELSAVYHQHALVIGTLNRRTNFAVVGCYSWLTHIQVTSSPATSYPD